MHKASIQFVQPAKADNQSKGKLIGFDRRTWSPRRKWQGNTEWESVSQIIGRFQCQSTVSLTQYGLYMLFVSVVVKDSFMIPEHVVHCSAAALHSEAISLKELMRGEKQYKRNFHLCYSELQGLGWFGVIQFLWLVCEQDASQPEKQHQTLTDSTRLYVPCLWEGSHIFISPKIWSLTRSALQHNSVIGKHGCGHPLCRECCKSWSTFLS